METEVKDNPYTGLWNKLDEDKANAFITYKQQLEEDKDKDFMDLLPPDFKNVKKSILRKQVLQSIENTWYFLNKCNLYDGRIFDRKDIVRSFPIKFFSTEVGDIFETVGVWHPFDMPTYKPEDMPGVGYLGTVEVSTLTGGTIGYHAWEQNDSEFVYYQII